MPPGWAVPSIHLSPALSIFPPKRPRGGGGTRGRRGRGEHPHLGAAAAPGEDKTDPIPGEAGPVPEETAQIPGRNHPGSPRSGAGGGGAGPRLPLLRGGGRTGAGAAGKGEQRPGKAPSEAPRCRCLRSGSPRPAAARWMRAGLARPRSPSVEGGNSARLREIKKGRG